MNLETFRKKIWTCSECGRQTVSKLTPAIIDENGHKCGPFSVAPKGTSKKKYLIVEKT